MVDNLAARESPVAKPQARRIRVLLAAAVILAAALLAARLGLHGYCIRVVISRAVPGQTRFENIWGLPSQVALELTPADSRVEIDRLVWCLSQLESLSGLTLSGEGVTDAELLSLKSLYRLTFLTLSDTQVTARGLGVLDDLPNLEVLALVNAAHVDDTGLVPISRRSTLLSLTLDGAVITDAGLAQLTSLPGLVDLSLDRTGIGDAGLQHLRHLKKLRRLSLTQTETTDTGIAELCEALPNLEVTDD